MTTRIRSRDNVSPVLVDRTRYKHALPSGPTTIRSVTHNVLIRHEEETISDEITPGFHSASAEGAVVINPVSHVKYSTKPRGSGVLLYKRKYANYNEEYRCENQTAGHLKVSPGRICTIPSVPVPTYDMVSAAKLQALGNLDRTPYSFAEDLAEMHETLRFLRDPLGSLRKLSQEFKGRVDSLLDLKRNLSRADAIANVWLQYQFAFLPLIRSANDAIASVGNKTRRPKRRTARGRSVFSGSDSDTQVTLDGYYSHASVTTESTVRAGILYEVTNPLEDWQFKYGLRFKDIPETLWAIFPYSFMVDRIFNLSQSVRGLVSFLDPNVNILGAWDSVKSSTISIQGIDDVVSPNVIETMLKFVPDEMEYEEHSYTRNVWVPSIGDLLPEVRLGDLIDTSTKIADLAALIWQRIR